MADKVGTYRGIPVYADENIAAGSPVVFLSGQVMTQLECRICHKRGMQVGDVTVFCPGTGHGAMVEVENAERIEIPEVSGSGYARKPVSAASASSVNLGAGFARRPVSAADMADAARRFVQIMARGEIYPRPFRDGWNPGWADQLEPAAWWPDWKAEMESKCEDPYREGPFERVWVRRERNDPVTTFGLQFAGKFVEGGLHPDVILGPEGGWPDAVDMCLDEILRELLPEPEPPFEPGVTRTRERRDAVRAAFGR